MHAAEMAVCTQFRAGMRYPKAGAVLSELQAAVQEQGKLDLISVANEPNRSWREPRTKLMAAMNAFNDRFGCDSVRLGNTTVAGNGADFAVRATKQERRSPRDTTRWGEIPIVAPEAWA